MVGTSVPSPMGTTSLSPKEAVPPASPAAGGTVPAALGLAGPGCCPGLDVGHPNRYAMASVLLYKELPKKVPSSRSLPFNPLD